MTHRNYSILSFSLFSAWLLAFPFEGQVLYAVARAAGTNGASLSLMAVSAHFIGLLTGGFFIKSQAAAKTSMIAAMVVGIASSLVFYLPYFGLWYLSIVSMALFAALATTGWAYYFKNYTPAGGRLKTAAEMLICTNIIMLFINVLTAHTSAYVGLGAAIMALVMALLMTFRLEACPNEDMNVKNYAAESLWRGSAIFKPLVFLCVFIFVLTINSGLMYQVVTPAFAHFEVLTSYYWAVPYIAVLVILRNMSAKVNRAYILYIAMVMIGLSFISFLWLDRSVTSYLVIDTLLLGAFGVCDLFVWTILGGFLDYSENPAQILGIGLSMNVLGILVGGYMGNAFFSTESSYLAASAAALTIIFAVLIMFPIFNNQLTRLFKRHTFLIEFAGSGEKGQDESLLGSSIISEQLTDKEKEVVKLLLRGYTYKAISENLFISENTIKYHVKNIYQKLNINSKMDLIKIFSDKEKYDTHL